MNKYLLTLMLLASTAFAGIEDYSTTPSNNNAAVPNGWPVGMNPADVKLSARQNMADLRSWYDDAQWIDDGLATARVSDTAFYKPGDVTQTYHNNRRVKLLNGSQYIYGTIVSQSVTGASTTILVAPDSGTVSTTLSRIWYGAASALSPSIVSSTLGLGDIGTPQAIVSGTTNVTANGSGYISFTTSGVVTSYLTSAGLLVGPGISTTGVISSTGLYSTGDISATGKRITVAEVSASGTITATTINASTISASTIRSPGIAAAWVLGGSLTGTWAISASHNVSSISRITAGEYNVSFTTPFSSANYVTAATCDTPNVGANECQVMVKLNGRAAGGIRLLTRYNGGQNDVTGVNAVFFGAQ